MRPQIQECQAAQLVDSTGPACGRRLLKIGHAPTVVLDQLAGTATAGSVANTAGRVVRVSPNGTLLVGEDLELTEESLRSGRQDP